MKNDKDSESSLVPGVDPNVEKKVDELMSVEPLKQEEQKLSVDIPEEPSSAPLLPSDKLPDLGETHPKKETPVVKPELAPIPINKPKEEEKPQFTPPEKLSLEDKVGVETPATNRAVEEIEAEEAQKKLSRIPNINNNSAPQKKKRGFFYKWSHNKIYRRLTYLAVIIIAVILAVVPDYRYFILNTFGVRASTSMKIIDGKTRQPLKNADVSLDGQTFKTGIDGEASFNGIKLGKKTILISKPAFAQVEKTVVMGWGSNPLEDFSLEPVGSRHTFILSDYVSGSPIIKAEAISGESSAVSNEKGELVLVVPNTQESEIEITLKANNYRDQKLKLPIDDKKTQEIKLVPAKKDIYVSKRDGTLDVYISYVDGKGEEKVLEGSGNESESNTALVPHQNRELAAYVSTQGKAKDSKGKLLASLSAIDISSKKVNVVATGESMQVVGWSDSKLIYVKVAQDTKEDDKKRSKLMSYDVDTSQEKELYSTNYFNGVLLVGGTVYYTPASFSVNGKVGLYKINADGSGQTTLYDKEVWNLFRTSYDKVSMSVGDNWFELKLADNTITKTNGPPAVMKSRLYIDNESKDKSLWVDQRDGKGVLLMYDKSSNKDTVIATASGLKQPVRWLDNAHAVYRKSDGIETANYVVSINGGQPKKISDVTNIPTIDSWYYF